MYLLLPQSCFFQFMLALFVSYIAGPFFMTDTPLHRLAIGGGEGRKKGKRDILYHSYRIRLLFDGTVNLVSG